MQGLLPEPTTMGSPECQGPGTKPGLAEQCGAEGAYLDMELPQALLEELGICGEGDRSHLCKTWTPPPQPPGPCTSFSQCHPLCQGSWHLPWLKHLGHSGYSIYPSLAPGEKWVWAEQA